MLALVGPHRTGKTTLAAAYAEHAGVPFVKTDVSGVMERMQIDPKRDLPFSIRIEIQEEILVVLDQQFRKAGVNFITDRSPLDALMYTMAEVLRENLDAYHVDRFEAYRERCFEATNRHFTNLILVQPAIKIKDAPGKAPPNKAYMEHLNTLMLGLLAAEENKCSHYYIPRAVMNLERRVAAVDYAVKKVKDGFAHKVEALRESGQSWH